MARVNRVEFHFEAGALTPEDVAVSRIVGREAISTPYRFDVDFRPLAGDPLELADLVGKPAALTLQRPEGEERKLQGVLSRVALVEVASGVPLYRARLEPKLALLRHVSRSRIFQALTVPQIVAKVLDGARVSRRLALRQARPAREYTVQYRESDLAFVSRLLEAEGIFFFFEPGDSAETVVLADAGDACAAIPGEAALPFRGDARVFAEEELVVAIARSRGVVPGKVTLRDFDFVRPDLDLTAAASGDGDADIEVYRYPGGYPTQAEGRRIGKLRLEELAFPGDRLDGRSSSQRIGAGFTFEIAEHPDASFDEKLLAVRVEHEGRRQGSAGGAQVVVDEYENRFVAVPAERAYRPRRRVPAPLVPGVQTATVVGPAGEEIHVDGHGRIKVQFHWDREGRKDENASCWVRVARSWAGAAWGASFVPRIGQEVVVRFIDGDPDRPLVVGAVFNGQNPPPIALPDEKTKSSLRTASSPGSDGANELRFEDAKDAEEIHLHVQKDEKIEVGNDKAQSVGHDEELLVEKDRSRTVNGNQTLKVAQRDQAEVKGEQTLLVGGKRVTGVVAGHDEAIVGSQTIAVGSTRVVGVALAASETVGAAKVLNVGGGYLVNVLGAANTAVAGLRSVQVGGARLEFVGATRDEEVKKNSSARVGSDFQTEVSGSATSVVGKDLKRDVGGKAKSEMKEATGWLAKSFKLEADKLAIEVGGKKLLVVEKSGKITLAASSVSVDGSSKIVLKGATIKKTSGSSPPSAKKAPEPEKSLTCRFGVTKAKCGDEVTLTAAALNLPDGDVTFKLDATPKGGSLGTVKAKLAKGNAQAKWVSKKPDGAKGVECEASSGGKKGKAEKLELLAYADVAAETKTIACKSGVFGWTGKFDAALKDGVVQITTRVKLAKRAGDKPDSTSGALPAAGTVDAATKATMKADIEGKLTDKWLLHRKSCKRGSGCDCAAGAACCKLKVKIEVEFVESNQHHDVNLWTGKGRANSGNFTLQKTRENSWAHETGHLLGWYDEYSTGAVGAAPRWIANNPTAVMNVGLAIPATYYWDFRDWLAAKTGEEWELIAK